ncbi:MBL fold metallo-hydrolase [Marinobacter panjinensis]|uniref:MBL fold metallo-hydrolase n=1 Tax=Marinobacter panjinensis TaxID=2576384 RepID=A0A4U6R3Z2_9GAMM|nr:MBL fold metallo-hydrolase [Marinobacter panjinensis]MCR8916018.1 MBL fold metallo-hydrolase [Marinobacter panjinensis]TKV67016.1 MBL fold metallo-hydrolase [Marinobacter panjinensis]
MPAKKIKILISSAGTAAAMLIGSGTLAAESMPEYPPLTIPFEADPVSVDNVYYFSGHSGVPGEQNEGFTANAGFVITEKGVVVFDALGTPSLGAAMVDKIREITELPITQVVISHYHADHVYGLQAFRELTEAEVIAQEASSVYVNSSDAGQRLEQRRKALSPWVDDNTRLVAPDVTFQEEMVLESGSYRFRIVHAGPAHSPDDSLMMVEPAGVLFSGDIIQNDRVPYLASSEVDTGNWMNAIDKVRELNPRILIPGHGKASENAMEALNFTYDYLAYVRDRMGAAVEGWVEFEDAYEQSDWSRYENLPAFDASNKANAYRVYLEMEKAALGGG